MHPKLSQMTVVAARTWLRAEVQRAFGKHQRGDKHVEQPCCPVCALNAGYEFTLSGVHAIELARLLHAAYLVTLTSDDNGDLQSAQLTQVWIHVPTVLGSTADSYSQDVVPSMKHMGLVEPSITVRGEYRLTSVGRNWLLGKVKVPRHAWIFRDELVGLYGAKVSAHDLARRDALSSAMTSGKLS